MAKLVWDAPGERLFEVGVDHCALYPQADSGEYIPGVAWNGITSVSETPDGAEPQDQYADNIKYLSIRSAENLNGTIEAFMYPPEWGQCDGSVSPTKGVFIGQQNRRTFGLAYRTKIGNDIDNEEHGYKLHLLYGATASPSERTYETINDSPEPITFSWEYTTTPVPVTNHKPTALLTIDSTLVDAQKLLALEDILYGTDVTEGGREGVEPRLPLPNEVIALIEGDAEAGTRARQATMVRGARTTR